MKSPKALNSETKNEHNIIDRDHEENRDENEIYDQDHKQNHHENKTPDDLPSKYNCALSIERSSESIDLTPYKKEKTRRVSIEKMRNVFGKKEDPFDRDIKIKLALQEKIGEMYALETLTSSNLTSKSCSIDQMNEVFQTPDKKIMTLSEQPSILKSMKFISPFKNREKQQHKVEDPDKAGVQSQNDKVLNTLLLRSSEFEPSVHQMKIPSANEFLLHARVCALLESYDELLEKRTKAGKRWFSYGELVGLDRNELQNMYLSAIGEKPEIPSIIGENQPPPLPHDPSTKATIGLGNPFEVKANEIGSLSSFTLSFESSSQGSKRHGRKCAYTKTKPHPATIKSLLECADDIIVEGYFTETIGNDMELMEGTDTSNVQVAIFSSYRQREYIVCFRGSMIQYTNITKAKGNNIKTDSSGGELAIQNAIFDSFKILISLCLLSSVIKYFSDVYIESHLEEKIFNLLDQLTTENPFCDVSFVGHAFSGGLAMLAALHYAENYPMMTVSCHSFGCPKIGKQCLRERSHSLPNLAIFRVEYGSYSTPYDPLFHHIGHLIWINRTSKEKRTSSNIQEQVIVQAFKFGNSNPKKKDKGILKKSRIKSNQEMRSYVHALESFTYLGCQWVEKGFVGEDGDGIIGASDKEERIVV